MTFFDEFKLTSPADIVSMLNGLFGIVAIYFIINGELVFSSFLLFVSMFFDRLDGTVARMFKSKHNKGMYVDSVADVISFATAPALLFYFSFTTAGMLNFFVILASVFIFAFGVMRLVKFSLSGYKLKIFAGIPTPATTFFVIMLNFLFGNKISAYNLPLFSTQPLIAIPLVLVVSVMMMSNVPFPKLIFRIKYLLLLAGFAIGFVLFLYVLYLQSNPLWSILFYGFVLVMFIIVVLYFLVGPFALRYYKSP